MEKTPFEEAVLNAAIRFEKEGGENETVPTAEVLALLSLRSGDLLEAQAFATLALAGQVKRVADCLENNSRNDTFSVSAWDLGTP